MKVSTIAVLVSVVAALAGQQDAEKLLAERLTSLEAQLRSQDSRLRWRGVEASVRVGAPAVPLLLRLLGKRDATPLPVHVGVAAMALMRMGKDAVPCLAVARGLLGAEESVECNELGLELLARIGPHDPDELETNKRAIYDQLRMARGKRRVGTSTLASRMVRMLGAVDLSIGEVLEHLEGKSEAHTEMALDRLHWRLNRKSGLERDLGKSSERVTQALGEIVRGEIAPKRTNFRFTGKNWGWGGSVSARRGSEIRAKAALLLQRVAPGKRLPAAALVALLRNPDPAIRRRSVLAIGALGSSKNADEEIDETVVRALIKATGDSDKMVGWDAITALGMLGPRARSAIRVLQSFVATANKPTAVRSRSALRQIQPGKAK